MKGFRRGGTCRDEASGARASARRCSTYPRTKLPCCAATRCPTNSSGNSAACMPWASIPSAISPSSSPSQDQPSIAHSIGAIPLSVLSCPLPESTRGGSLQRLQVCLRVPPSRGRPRHPSGLGWAGQSREPAVAMRALQPGQGQPVPGIPDGAAGRDEDSGLKTHLPPPPRWRICLMPDVCDLLSDLQSIGTAELKRKN